MRRLSRWPRVSTEPPPTGRSGTPRPGRNKEERTDQGEASHQVQPSAEKAQPVQEVSRHGRGDEQAAQSDGQPPAQATVAEEDARFRGRTPSEGSRPCSSCAATPTAIEAGHL